MYYSEMLFELFYTYSNMYLFKYLLVFFRAPLGNAI